MLVDRGIDVVNTAGAEPAVERLPRVVSGSRELGKIAGQRAPDDCCLRGAEVCRLSRQSVVEFVVQMNLQAPHETIIRLFRSV